MNASTLQSIFTGVSAIGSTASAYGQYQQGQAQREAYEYNADIAMRNASRKEQVVRRQYRRLMGEQKALYAEAGVDITSGSPLLVLAAQAAEAETEALSQRYSGMSEAESLRSAGRNVERAATIGALSTFVTGLGKAATSYSKLKKMQWEY